jgi:lipoprotein-anchoring transpeptidase ErfK/SrfK
MSHPKTALFLTILATFGLQPSIAQDYVAWMPSPAIPLLDESLPAEEEIDNYVLSEPMPQATAVKGLPVVVVVDQSKHLTHVLQVPTDESGLVEVLCLKNSTGKPSTPTPNGRMTVISKQLDPVWTPPVSIDPKQRKVERYSKNKHNPLGPAFIALNKGFIGLHGTNQPKQIGLKVSHGCIRHLNVDIMKLYLLVQKGTAVYIVDKLADARIQAKDLVQERRPIAELNLDTPSSILASGKLP